MKKIFSAVIILLLCNTANAQTKVILKIGGNKSTAKVVDSSIEEKHHYVTGFSAGVTLDVPFEGALHFTPSIGYSRRGYAFSQVTGPIRKTKNTIHYIDLTPGATLNFSISKNKKSAVILGLGPTLSTAISGTEKNTFASDSVATNKMVFSYTVYSRIDVGLTASISVKLNKFLLESSCFFGLANTENDESLLRNIQSRTFSVSIGYYLR